MRFAGAICRSSFSYLCAFRSVMTSKMSMFVSKFNQVTGKQDWVIEDSNYDYHQEVARSAYADMLHDTERNQKYYEGLRLAVTQMKVRGQPANVLDIGTGTGLLSMMAVHCGADTVTACEAFHPMAECARQVMQDNGMLDRIRLIPKRSTELTVGPDGDILERANILVTEVFDTELIGEGAIATLTHAHQHLLQKDCIVIPSAANMYVQIVQSEFLHSFNTFRPISIAGCADIMPPGDISRCPGAAAVHDLQLTQLRQDQFTPITDVLKIFRFDYSGQTTIKPSQCQQTSAIAETSGDCHAVLMWWDLEMDTEGKVILSCAPNWAHPTPDNMQWRDHWMQAVYYPQDDITVLKGDTLNIHGNHDDYSLWFNVTSDDHKSSVAIEMALTPACNCGAHIVCSRTRISMINDSERNEKMANYLAKVVQDKVCLCLGDGGSLLPLIAARLRASKVYAVERQPAARSMLTRYIEHNNLQSTVMIIDKHLNEITLEDLGGKQVDVLAGEPYYSASILPWHNLTFWYERSALHTLLQADCVTVPAVASICAIAVEFDDLCKIRSPVGVCEGFKLHAFDTFIQKASEHVDACIEPQPLWEYPALPLSDQFSMVDLDLTKSPHSLKSVKREGHIALWSSGSVNGVALWLHLGIDAETSISGGLRCSPTAGKPLIWDPHTRQGVYLFPQPVSVTVDGATSYIQRPKLKYSLTFMPHSGEFSFDFSVVT